MTEGEEEEAMQDGEQENGECEWAPNSSLHLPLSLFPLRVSPSLCVTQLRGVLAHIIVLGFDILFLFCNTFVMLVLSSLLLLLLSSISSFSNVRLWQRQLAEASSFLELRSVNCN